MIIRIVKERNYSVISNHGLDNKKISFKAKGLYAYCLRQPDDWEFNIEDLSNRSTDGRDSVRAGLNELQAEGYLARVTKKVAGKFDGVDYTFHEVPFPNAVKPQKPQTEIPFTENPTSEIPPLLNTPKNQVLQEPNTQEAEAATDGKSIYQKQYLGADLNVFWKLIEAHRAMPESKQARDKLNNTLRGYLTRYCASPSQIKDSAEAISRWFGYKTRKDFWEPDVNDRAIWAAKECSNAISIVQRHGQAEVFKVLNFAINDGEFWQKNFWSLDSFPKIRRKMQGD